MGSDYLHIKSVNDINLKNILDDYRSNFVGHVFRVETNYNLLSQIDILFSENDLPHLMGWQKVRNKNKNAKKIIMDVANKRFTTKEAKKNSNWKNIKSRMTNYNFLHEIFIEKSKSIMVLTSDMKPNRLKLDVVFLKNHKRESIILGLRKVQERNVFVPTTLHVEGINNQYNRRRRTKINKIEILK